MKNVLLGLFAIFFAFNCFSAEFKPYQIVSERNTSFPNRQRVQIFIISPEAKSLQQRADTTIRAATDYANKNGTKVVTAFLVPVKEAVGKGYNLAIANFWSDGCGYSGTQCDGEVWKIQATDQQLSNQQINVVSEFYSNQNKFLDQYDLPDENKLIAYIAKKLKIKKENVVIPVLFLKDVK